ncbi:MAG: Gfo/Idh/MocA family oxidoreductase [Bacteroidota bacterium]
MKIAIIGGGAVAEMFHIPASIELLGIENVYLIEKEESQRKKLISKFSLIHVFESYESNLNQVDIVIIATPPHTHLQIIADCISNNIPVLCEKPLVLKASECDEIIKLNTNNGLIALCHTYRFFPNRNEVKRLLKENFFGENIFVSIQEGDPTEWPVISGYTFRKELVPGGVLLDGGIHSLDFLLWCFGEVKSLSYEDDSLGGIESNAEIKLVFEENTKAIFRISRTCSLENKITISGDKNSVELDIFEMSNMKINGIETKIDSEKKYDWSTIASYQLQDFIDSVSSESTVKCSLEDGIKVINVIDSCYSIKKNKALLKEAPLPGLRF